MIDGVVANMIVAVELIQKAIDPMVAKKFGRIVNITSGSVKMPLFGLDLSSGARAGLTAFLAGVARSVAASNVTINFLLPGHFRHRPLPLQRPVVGEEARHELRGSHQAERRVGSGRAGFGNGGRVRRDVRVSVLGAGRLYHRTESSDRRRTLPRRILNNSHLGLSKITDPRRVP